MNVGAGWKPRASPESRVITIQAFGYAAVDNLLYIAGGLPPDSLEPERHVAVYDMVADKWYPVTSLSSARDCSGVVILYDRLFVFGGFGPTHEHGSILSTTEYLGLVLPKAPGSSSATDGDEIWWVRQAVWYLFVGMMLYCIVGALFGWREGRQGLRVLPNLDFWTSELPTLVMDGLVFSVEFLSDLVSIVKEKFASYRSNRAEPQSYQNLSIPDFVPSTTGMKHPCMLATLRIPPAHGKRVVQV